jgi:hypothetical protein
MAKSTRKLIDLTGAPFVVEKADDGKYYIIGIKLRSREFLFANGIPENVIDKITGNAGNNKIDGVEEIEEFLEGMPEGSKLDDAIPEGYVDDNDVIDTWQQMLRDTAAAANGNNS